MEKKIKSDISKYYKFSIDERRDLIYSTYNFSEVEKSIMENSGYFKQNELEKYSENVVGSYQLPFSIATNFLINGKDYLIPMVTEEPSVVAAASNGAKFARKMGGFHVSKVDSIMIGQIQITNINSEEKISIKTFINNNIEKLEKIANDCDPVLVSHGGGVKQIEIRDLDTIRGAMLILHLQVDVLDAMGANAVNTMVEAIAKYISTEIPIKINIKIISNLSIHRIAECQAIFDTVSLGGSDVVNNILDAWAFAQADPFRAATHNKGIMNGICAVALATGNDTRALEAGAHAYAWYSSSEKQYSPLSNFYLDENENLVGKLTIPLAMATIGGIIGKHPMTKIALKILNISSANELSQVTAAVGLAQNIAALRALSSEGIQQGHMKLHKRKLN